jgi:exopolysaccharide biosynthesis operon protein EpsL
VARFLLASLLALSGAAFAQQDRPLMVRAGGSLTTDSNIFRSPEARAERIAGAFVGLRLDQPYRQQHFFVDVTQGAYRHDNFPHLDFDPLQYRAAWSWHLTPRVSGQLGAERAESLVSYADFRDPSQRNVRTAENRFVSADAWLFSGWHLLGALRREDLDYSVPFPQEGSYRGNAVEGGVRYDTRAGSSLSAGLRSLHADYDRPLDPVALRDDAFVRKERELRGVWRSSGKTSVDARIARVEHRSANFDARSFSGTAGALGAHWAATGKLALRAALSRDLEPWTDSFASYRVNQRLIVSPEWQLSARTALRLALERADAEYRGAPASSAAAGRRDQLSAAQLALEWHALRNLRLYASLQRQRQTSSDAAAQWRASGATLGGSLLF